MIRLMIIDDHEMVREGLKAMLVTEPDFQIVGDAADAQQALVLIEQLRRPTSPGQGASANTEKQSGVAQRRVAVPRHAEVRRAAQERHVLKVLGKCKRTGFQYQNATAMRGVVEHEP